MFILLLQMRGSFRLLLIFFVFLVSSSKLVTPIIHTIYWNASNPLFSKGDYEINVRLGDKIKVICPQLKRMEDDDGAYLIIHKDSEMAHMNCVLENPKIVTICNDPMYSVTSNTMVRKYHPNKKDGLEFEPGQTHYFLSTSRGTKDSEGMNKGMGGMCKHDHMRMKIIVDEFDPSTVIDTTRSTLLSTSSVPNVSRFSVPMKGGEKGEGKRIIHEQRRHTKKEHDEPTVERFSESDIREYYYHATSEESPESVPSSGWDAIKMNADEMVGDLRGGYASSYPDYIISERSSSCSFSFFILSIIILISLR